MDIVGCMEILTIKLASDADSTGVPLQQAHHDLGESKLGVQQKNYNMYN